MVYTIKAGSKAVPLIDTTAYCTAVGIKVVSLDGNGTVYVSTDQPALDKTNPTSGHPQAGILLQQLSSPTNISSLETFAPFRGVLYARNIGAADSDISVELWPME